jgi:hypothetical protein
MTDCERGRLSLGSLYAALREITDDPPTEISARLLPEALDCLPGHAFASLVEEVRRYLIDEAEHGARLALEQVRVSVSVERSDYSVGSRRAAPSSVTPFPARTAILLQALIWAVLPPEKRDPGVCY